MLRIADRHPHQNRKHEDLLAKYAEIVTLIQDTIHKEFLANLEDEKPLQTSWIGLMAYQQYMEPLPQPHRDTVDRSIATHAIVMPTNCSVDRADTEAFLTAVQWALAKDGLLIETNSAVISPSYPAPQYGRSNRPDSLPLVQFVFRCF